MIERIDISPADTAYLSAVSHVMKTGHIRPDRTGTGTRSTFCVNSSYDLHGGFPLLLSKFVPWKTTVSELLWFLEGSTSERRLAELYYGQPRSELSDRRTIWTDNAEAFCPEKPDQLGFVYGFNWRRFGGSVDQIANVIKSLKEDPYSRRHLVTALDPVTASNAALPPCHTMFQFYVRDVLGMKFLDCMMYQRSADMALGVPVNIASYALLTELIARECGYHSGTFSHVIGDAHIYLDHVEGLEMQLKRWELARTFNRAHFDTWPYGNTSTVFSLSLIHI